MTDDDNEEEKSCRCYKCIESKLAEADKRIEEDKRIFNDRLEKCEKEKEKECNHIDMVSNALTKRIGELCEEVKALRGEVNKLKIDLDWRVGNVTSNFSAIKEQIEEIEKSIADQAIKALHTHPEMLQPLSDMTKRISELDGRLQDQIDDHCGRIKDLETAFSGPYPGTYEWAKRLDSLEKSNGELCVHLAKLETRMDKWASTVIPKGNYVVCDYCHNQLHESQTILTQGGGRRCNSCRIAELESFVFYPSSYYDDNHPGGQIGGMTLEQLYKHLNQHAGGTQVRRRLDDLENRQMPYDIYHKIETLTSDYKALLKQYEKVGELEKWKENADEGMNNGAKRREQLEERLNTFSWRMAKVEEWIRSFPQI